MVGMTIKMVRGNMKKICNGSFKMIVFMSIICLLIGIVTPNSHAAIKDKEERSDVFLERAESIINWKKADTATEANQPLLNNAFLENAGDTSGDWFPLGLGRIGYEDDYDSYLAIIRDVVEKRYKEEGKLSSSKATEWHRISLAILASGGDPTKVGQDNQGNPIHLIADGTYNRGEMKSLGAQGLNGWIWGLITLDSMRYIVPEDAHDTRQLMIENILEEQLPKGGFSLNYPEPDPDMTAMALQALAPYYNSEETYTYEQRALEKEVTKTVRQAVDEGLDVLAGLQLAEGDYESWGSPNVESTAQVIVALTSLGIDPFADERFIKNENTSFDGMMIYFKEDEGGFIHSESYDAENPSSLPQETNSMASEQALYTLAALYRHHENNRTLYDFREEMDPDLKEEIASIQQIIDTIPEELTEENQPEIAAVFEEYLAIPIEERAYVFNYYKLADAMEAIGIDNTSEPIAEHMGVHQEGKGTILSLDEREKTNNSKTTFTEEDAQAVAALPENVTTEDYVEVAKRIDQLEDARNKATYQSLLQDLKEKKAQIEKIKAEIESINETIMEQLYPFSDIAIKDKANVEKIVERYEALSPYDQRKIQSYEDVEKANTQIANLIRARSITIAAVSLILVIGIYYRRRRIKRKQAKLQQKMLIDLEE